MQAWISVKDRLPFSYQNVFFVVTEEQQVYPGYFIAAPAFSEERNFLGVFRVGYYFQTANDLLTATYNVWARSKSDVLYWQPFPDAPETTGE